MTSVAVPKRPRRRAAAGAAVVLPSAALVATAAAPDLQVLPLASVLPSVHNPRTDADADLGGLAASLATEREPYLLQPPVVEAVSDGYRIVSGERRVRGAALAGWTTVACLVRPPLDPVLTHTMRIVENLHSADLHPLDAATALKIAWLAENGLALGAGEAVTGALAQKHPPTATLAALGAVVAEAGFVPSHPAVTWQALLGRLGLALDRERLKKLLRVLNLYPAVLDAVRPLDLSEAALRALGTLDDTDQQHLATALVSDPTLGTKIRRIARRVKQKGYPIAKAIAEARGEVYLAPVPNAPPDDEADTLRCGATGDADQNGGQEGYEGSERVHPFNDDDARETAQATSASELTDVGPACADAVLRLLDLAEQVSHTVTTITTTANGVALADLPPPWGDIVREAATLLDTTFTDHTLHSSIAHRK